MTHDAHWQVPEQWPELGQGIVDVFLLEFPDDDTIPEERLAMLSDDCQVRAERYKIPQRRAEFVYVRSHLREILGRYLQVEPSMVRLGKNEHGKPVLEGDSGLEFNLAHSGRWSMLAVSASGSLGVDIEQDGRKTDPMALISRFFSRQEQSALLALDERLQRQAFFDCWARKEAFVKAVGTGIAYGLGAFSVPLGALDSAAVVRCEKEGKDWYMHQVCAPEGYHAALVTECPDATLRYWRL